MTQQQCFRGGVGAAHLAPRSRTSRAPLVRWAQRLAGAGLVLGLWAPAHAAEFRIPAGDGAALLLAITTANTNGESNTIHLAAGTYTLTAVHSDTDGPTGLPSVTSTLTLRGAGADQTIVARAQGAPPFRLLHVAATGRLTVHRLTVTQGKVEEQEGGGLFNRGTLLLRDSTVSGNHAGAGGGIATAAGTVTLTRSTLRDNGTEGGDGGGLYAHHGSTVTLRQSTVSGNGAGYGGGLYSAGPLVLHQSTVRDNWAEGRGAGIYSAGTLLLRQSTVSGNQAEDGGGLYTEDAVQILASTISGNTAYRWEGGGLKTARGPVTLQNSTVSGNTAQYGGGGLVFGFGTVTILTSTVSGNTVESDYEGAGGILATASPAAGLVVRLRQSLVAGNTAPREVPAPPADCAVQGTAQLTSAGQNLVGAGTGCPSDGSGDLTVDPTTVFPAVLGPLRPNGGPTQTHALQPDSPALDAGTAPCPATDQRGVPRPQGAGCDIGAVEQEEP